MQAGRKFPLGEALAVPACQGSPPWLGSQQMKGVKIRHPRAVQPFTGSGLKWEHAPGPPGLRRRHPAPRIEHARDSARGRGHCQPRPAGQQIAAADQPGILRPVPSRRLPGAADKLVPDSGHQYSAFSDADHGRTHPPIVEHSWPDTVRAAGAGTVRSCAGLSEEVVVVRMCIPVTKSGAVDPRWGRADRVAVADVSDGQVTSWEEFQVQWGVLQAVLAASR